MKSGTSNTTNGPGDSTTSNHVGPDAMTWASTWEMMNRTLERFATRNTDSSERGGGKSRKTFKKPKEFKDDSDGCIDTWVEVIRLHLEQDTLNDERQACTAILSNLEGTALNCVVAKKEGRGTLYCRQNLRDFVEPIRIRNEGSPNYDEIRKEKTEGRRINQSVPG